MAQLRIDVLQSYSISLNFAANKIILVCVSVKPRKPLLKISFVLKSISFTKTFKLFKLILTDERCIGNDVIKRKHPVEIGQKKIKAAWNCNHLRPSKNLIQVVY